VQYEEGQFSCLQLLSLFAVDFMTGNETRRSFFSNSFNTPRDNNFKAIIAGASNYARLAAALFNYPPAPPFCAMTNRRLSNVINPLTFLFCFPRAPFFASVSHKKIKEKRRRLPTRERERENYYFITDCCWPPHLQISALATHRILGLQ